VSLPWFQFKTMDPIPSIARGAWESEPPEWVMRAEFSALLASGQVAGWSLRQLAERWATGRKKARRVLVTWAEDTADQVWPRDLLQAAAHAHPWLEEPLRERRVTSSVPTTPVQSPAVTAPEEPRKDHERTTQGPLTGARSSSDREEEVEAENKEPGKPDPVQVLYDVWRGYHPRARPTPRSADASKLRGRLREDSAADCALVCRWLHEAPDASWWQEEKRLGLTPCFKADKWSDRLDSARAWDQEPTVIAPPPEPDLSGLSVGELVDLESNHANIQALRRRRKQESI
jgi:hypothetical protein